MSSAEGKKRAKLVDVAKLAGVSPGTVSNALHNIRFVEPATRQRIEQAIEALNYIPNIRARQLRTGKTYTIALFSSVPLAIASGASRLGFMMEIALTSATIALERKHALILVPPGKGQESVVGYDAAIVIEPAENDPQIAVLEKSNIPYVTIGKVPNTPLPAPYVDLRSYDTALLLLDHLSQQGSKAVALFIGETRRNSSLETERCYREWCAGKQTPVVYYLNEEEGEQSGYDATQKLLHDFPETEGLLVLVDTFATGVVKALANAAVEIPGKMRVATRYDGIRSLESIPALTAVNLHLDEVARQAINLLFAAMEGEPVTHSDGVPPTLVPRMSTL